MDNSAAHIRKQRGGLKHSDRMCRGLSLIEILVVIVILLVGILTVIRLFPAGFISLRSAENATVANTMGQALLDSAKAGQGAPEGVYASVLTTDSNGNTTLGFDPTIDPDDFGPYTKNTAATDNAYSSDVNKARYIYREPVTIAGASVTGGTLNAPIYVPKFGPVYLPSQAVPTASAPGASTYLNIESAPWTIHEGDARVQGDARNIQPEDVLTPGHPEYLVDYPGGRIALPPAAYPQAFTLGVTIINTNGTNTPCKITLVVPAQDTTKSANSTGNYNGGWFYPTDPSLGYAKGVLPSGTILATSGLTVPWLPGTSVLTRPFVQVAANNLPSSPNPPYSVDPYEFAIPNANIAGTDANVGTIQFNPLAAGRGAIPALRAYISYVVFNWHILHEDHDLAGAATGTALRLAIGDIRRVGDIQRDQTTFSSIVPFKSGYSPTAADPQDFMLVDLATGQQITGTDVTQVYDADDGTGAAQANAGYFVSYHTGRVILNQPAAWFGAHARVRVYYAGAQDWAVALQKASAVYVQTTNVNDLATVPSAAVPNRFYYDAATSRIYFPACDRGKTIHLGQIQFNDKSAPPAAHVYDLDDAISTSTAVVGAVNLPYVDLTATLQSNAGGATPDPATVQFGVVRGVSSRAVIIWREGTNWRVRSVDGVLNEAK